MEEDKVPMCVILNPKMGGMFIDPLSGLHLTQWPTEVDGTTRHNWGHVPKGDTSRIVAALGLNILFPCNPKGESKHIPKVEPQPNAVETIMSNTTREVLATIDQITDATSLQLMEKYENGKASNKRRVTVLRAINDRLRSRDVHGIIGVDSTPAMIKDDAGNMVPDVIAVN